MGRLSLETGTKFFFSEIWVEGTLQKGYEYQYE